MWCKNKLASAGTQHPERPLGAPHTPTDETTILENEATKTVVENIPTNHNRFIKICRSTGKTCSHWRRRNEPTCFTRRSSCCWKCACRVWFSSNWLLITASSLSTILSCLFRHSCRQNSINEATHSSRQINLQTSLRMMNSSRTELVSTPLPELVSTPLPQRQFVSTSAPQHQCMSLNLRSETDRRMPVMETGRRMPVKDHS